MKRVAAIGAVLALLGGCSGSESAAPTPEPKPSKPVFAGNPDSYALDFAEYRTGERRRTGCLDASKASADGSHYVESDAAETDAGCIYSAAYAGCYEGKTGEQLGPMSYVQEFPEPGLQAIYRDAKRDCR